MGRDGQMSRLCRRGVGAKKPLESAFGVKNLRAEAADLEARAVGDARQRRSILWDYRRVRLTPLREEDRMAGQ